MLWIIIALYIAAALLPIFGLYRVVVRAHARPGKDPYADLDAEEAAAAWGKDIVRAIKSEALIDFVLIGLGLSCGAAASIWSLFI